MTNACEIAADPQEPGRPGRAHRPLPTGRDGLVQSISTVERLMGEVEKWSTVTDREDQGAPTEEPEAPGPESIPDRADRLRRLLDAHDEANRLAGEAARVRSEAAVRGRQIIAAAQDRAAALVAAARSSADDVRGECVRELTAAREQAAGQAREMLMQAATGGETLRRQACADAALVAERTMTWLAEQQQSAAVLSSQCREEARVEAVLASRRAREEGQRRAAEEHDTAVAAAVAGILAETGDLLTGAGAALTVVLGRIERTAASANRLDTGAGLALAGLREAQQALTGLLPAPEAPGTPR